jgi:putative endonuclease
MPQTSKQQLGKKGEQIAAEHLENIGHQIMFRNYRKGRSELDIISKADNVVVISEVKSYFADPLGPAEYRVNKKKQKQIVKGAYAFLHQYPEYQGMSVRFDVLIVDFSNYPAKTTHHEGAFFDEDGW